MKEQLLGRKPAQTTTTPNTQVGQEEVKAGGAVLVASESDGGHTTESQEDDNRVGLDSEKSFNSQIEVGEAGQDQQDSQATPQIQPAASAAAK